MKYKVTIFFIIGILLYIIDIGLNSYDDKEIYISDQEILSLVSAWKSRVGRNPTDDEIFRIIDSYIDEEILYREALLLGLDKEDRIIKRRLAQKISFLKEESIPNIPTKDEILKYYDDNKGEYFVDKTFTFTHLFFSSENNSEERAVNSYKDIIKGFDVNADPFFLGKNFTNKTLTNINSDFGKNFGDYFQNIAINEWSEPIESPFGHHLVYVFNKNDGYYPDITKIYKKVEMDLLQDKRDQAVKKFIDEIKSEYKVYINPDLQF
ncbi:MAG: peptidyl-prolyl cis-trans isomerase [Gammaproteobacteria bacterium]